jgi:hypothetical protein
MNQNRQRRNLNPARESDGNSKPPGHLCVDYNVFGGHGGCGDGVVGYGDSRRIWFPLTRKTLV